MARKLAKGQCFLCLRETVLERGLPQAPDYAYVCPHCGGLNRASRIEAGEDAYGRSCVRFGPVEEWSAERGES